MDYQIIQPPFTLAFREMSQNDLKAYNQWFHAGLNARIACLTLAVISTAGYKSWKPDCSPQSLDLLGEWFASQAEVRQRTQAEIDLIQNKSQFPLYVPDTELTDKTFSIATDIGMYVSQVFTENLPSIEWSQQLGSKKSVDYGQPVLVGFGAAPFNPVRMMITLAYGLVSSAKSGKSLRDIYNIWFALAA
jgi:hypothetical protein